MRGQSSLEAVLRQHGALTLFPEEEMEAEEQCIFAQQFEAYLKTVCQEALNHPSHLAINECYLEMFKKYMEWRNVVPRSHRNRIGEHGHRCIWHVLEALYQRVKLVELRLPSAKLYAPPPLPPPPFLPDIFVRE